MDPQSNDSNKVGLNRSYSFSGSPITQKVSVEQAFKNDRGETLIRQYSCEQIYSHSSKKPAIQLKESVIIHSPRKLRKSLLSSYDDSFLSNQADLEKFPFSSQSKNLFNFNKNCPEQKGFSQSLMNNKIKEDKIEECTPMEVDSSVDDFSMSDVHSSLKGDNESSDNDKHKPKISKLTVLASANLKNVTEKSDPTLVKSYRKIFLKYLKLFTILLIPIFCAVIMFHSDIIIREDPYISDQFQFENITNSLQDLLYGQPQVVSKIQDGLKNMYDKQLFIFTGGVGVGKTYTANIISNNFQWKDNIIKISAPQHKNEYHEINFLKSLSNNGYNLVVVDNLDITDVSSVIPFARKVFNTDKKVIMILIYTIPELSLDMSGGMDVISNSNKISESLSDAKLKHSLVMFHKLNVNVVKKCIRFALAQKGLIVNEHNIDNVLQNVNYEYSGCKGVYTKIALLR